MKYIFIVVGLLLVVVSAAGLMHTKSQSIERVVAEPTVKEDALSAKSVTNDIERLVNVTHLVYDETRDSLWMEDRIQPGHAALYRYDISSGTSTKYPIETQDSAGNPHSGGLVIDSSDRVWVSFSDTVAVLASDDAKVELRPVPATKGEDGWRPSMRGITAVGDDVWVARYNTKTLTRYNADEASPEVVHLSDLEMYPERLLALPNGDILVTFGHEIEAGAAGVFSPGKRTLTMLQGSWKSHLVVADRDLSLRLIEGQDLKHISQAGRGSRRVLDTFGLPIFGNSGIAMRGTTTWFSVADEKAKKIYFVMSSRDQAASKVEVPLKLIQTSTGGLAFNAPDLDKIVVDKRGDLWAVMANYGWLIKVSAH